MILELCSRGGKKLEESHAFLLSSYLPPNSSSHRQLFTGPYQLLNLSLSSVCIASWRESHLEPNKTTAKGVGPLQYISFTYSLKMCQVTNFVPINLQRL
jgi:hypothetical protein